MPIWGMHFAGCEIKNDTEVDMYIVRKADWKTVGTAVGIVGATVGIICGVGALAVGIGGGAGAAGAAGAAAGATEAAAAAAAGAAATAAVVEGAAVGFTLTASHIWAMVGVGASTVGLAGRLIGLTPEESEALKHDLEIAEEGEDVIVHTDKSIMDIIEGNSDTNLSKAMNMTEDQVRQMKKVIKDHKYGAERIAPGKSFKFDTGCYSTWKAHVITENLEEGVADVWTSFWYGGYSHYKASTLWKNLSAKTLPIAIKKEA